jgi:hypothetical protein
MLWEVKLINLSTSEVHAKRMRPVQPAARLRGIILWAMNSSTLFGLAWILGSVLLASCASRPPMPTPVDNPVESRALIAHLLPRTVSDRSGWAADLYSGFAALTVPPTRENICAVIAVIEQESGFHVDPVVPGLAAIAWREIDERAAHAGVPRMVLHGVLQLKSSTGRSYSERIDNAKTEKELSDIFEDFIAAVPMGHALFADRNPIRTRGPMQVHIAFAEQFAANRPYPYPVRQSIADEVFTRRGGLYFGIAHLLAYPASYDRYLFRFADFNAGQYASRNAAFQIAVARASGIPLVPDGALLPHESDAKGAGNTEAAVAELAPRLNIAAPVVHGALEQGKTKDFESTSVYQRAFALAEQKEGHPLARAALPQIKLQGPKIVRNLTTEWYARRVEQRFERCLR